MPDAHRRLILNGLWALVVFWGLVALLLHVVSVEAQDPVQHDIILLLDNSGSMVRPYRITATGTEAVTPYDADQRRIRFSRFLIRLLQSSTADNTALGAALFAAEVSGALPVSSTVILAPLTELSAWTAADVAAIQQQSCPAANARNAIGQPIAQQPGRDYCFGTRYAPALSWATQQLQRSETCGSSTRRCDILIFTDGAMGEVNSDTVAVVAESLSRLASQGINVSVVLFSSPNTEPANISEWRRWHESGIVKQVTTYSSNLPVQQLYAQGLSALGLEALVAGYTPIELPQKAITVADRLPLNTTSLHLDLITDSPITDTYSVTPTFAADRVRWWSAPLAATISGTLQGTGLLYYRAISETVPVSASVMLLPATQQEGKAVGMEVFVGVGNRVLDDSFVRVNGLVEPDGITTPLRYDSGVWRGELPWLKTGNHTVSALIEPTAGRIIGKPEVQTQVLRIVPQPHPMAALHVLPATVFAGRMFEMEASVPLEELPKSLQTGSPMAVTISPGEQIEVLQANPKKEGTWRGSAAIEQPGAYQLTGEIQERGATIATEAVDLTVLTFPQVQITAPVTEAVTGQKIAVSVTISPATYPLTPAIWIQRSLGRRAQLDVKKIAAGMFQAEVVMDSGRDLRIYAEVPAGEIQGARFETIQGETVLVRQKDAHTKNSVPLDLMVFAVLAATVISAIRWAGDPRRSLIPKLIEGEEKWSLLDTLSVEKNWREVKALGEHVDEGVLEYAEGRK